MIKVLIVDDSALIRKIITDILEEDREIKVIGTAKDGKEALEKIPRLKPDLITLDIEMPVMDGISTLKSIVEKHQIPVVMLSSLTVKGADLTLKALEIGAVDFITKPRNVFNIGSKDEKNQLIEKVKMASKTKVKKVGVYNRNIEKIKENTIKRTDYIDKPYGSIVAIGTSTGGPKALQEIIPNLPYNINASIVVVQHMPAGFTRSLANRLNSISQIKVKEGENGEKLKRGYCYIAPGDFHMSVEQNKRDFFIKLDKSSPISGLRPTADVLLKSVSKLNGIKKIGIILTGMGSDGAEGISQFKKSNGYTIAESEESCVVFGMPKSAINTGKIDLILPLNKIKDEIIKWVGV
ncbi:chemotaxis response regulator protein-glutamate methylesterase [Anaerosalibacter bizertensis]|uniref:Protein-glutamate methylesterase/protein-glutamine glutaminase n=1 Tax=Anaerosalibacter bizertensis TaxID=932217 RepID=A0A9Q4AC44_9FIRM|nr:chemotaxis response regulator protein-glutamate methylesterase [Anaerosalibacter bizertensis]MBV1818038.1 chemotaxis response regulator protein-glutamate methylesterase [Bacteroidales bacterium MSK.15.36]MBU5293276.1 chemotaxis response regulator protein-glutamate methylesterase [Anaerosalibacter bizertensis]MCB5558800.1 chemotaxis response regulator protein-glutamate methylesterase [Anaerosalibacter bizertensis]MCG4564632.1 chemotaxis response regulator protein-glutamate methylesterase [Ana